MNQPSQLPAQRRLYRAFLSHSHVDREFVKQLHHWLNQEAEIPIWYDAFNLSASAAIPTELANAISLCRSMIIVVSNSSIRSGWVEEEYNFAVNQRAKYRQFRIIPIRIEECELPGFLQSTKCIDAFDKQLNINVISELLTSLYYDDKALNLDNTYDIYISRSWRQGEADLADYICKMLDKAGFRLIGDSDDQVKYSKQRVQNIIKSCGGLVSIIPDHGGGTTSRYLLDEIGFAIQANLPYLIIVEPNVNLSGDIASHAVRASINDINNLDIIMGKYIEAFAEQWQQPFTPHYTFFSTSIEHEQINRVIQNAIQHITAMPCKVGDKIKESQIRESIVAQIINAQLVIADITQNNINSCIEAGIAIGAERPLKLIAHAPRARYRLC